MLLRAGLMGLLLVAVGCCPRITPSVTTEVSDSVWTKEIVRVDTFNLPGDTVVLEKIVIECDPETNTPRATRVTAKSDRAAVEFKIDEDGRGHVTAAVLDVFKLLEIRDKEINRLRNEKRIEVQVVTEYKTRSIDIFCRWTTGILFLILLGLAAFKYFKLSIPWIK